METYAVVGADEEEAVGVAAWCAPTTIRVGAFGFGEGESEAGEVGLEAAPHPDNVPITHNTMMNAAMACQLTFAGAFWYPIPDLRQFVFLIKHLSLLSKKSSPLSSCETWPPHCRRTRGAEGGPLHFGPCLKLDKVLRHSCADVHRIKGDRTHNLRVVGGDGHPSQDSPVHGERSA